jgi:hypothetical protein
MDRYGPNSEQVERFIDHLRRLTPGQRRHAAAVRRGARGASAFFAAREAVQREALSQAASAAQSAAENVVGEITAPAAGEAALALVVRDQLQQSEFESLYAPFAGMIPYESLIHPDEAEAAAAPWVGRVIPAELRFRRLPE